MGTILFIAFMLFKDTFRRERSLAYQTAVARLRIRSEKVKSREHASGNPDRKPENSTGTLEKDSNKSEGSTTAEAAKDIRLSLTDVNPVPLVVQIFLRKNNTAILFPSCENPICPCMI